MFQQLFSNYCFVCIFKYIQSTGRLSVKRNSIKLYIFVLVQEPKNFFLRCITTHLSMTLNFFYLL